MKFDVIGLDSPCVDLAVNVRCFPKPNGAERIQNLSWQGGGKVASGMVAAARLGLCCGIMGNVGDDKYGTFCLRDFQDHGIDTEQMCVRKNRTTNFDIVISDEGSMGRSFVFYPGNAECMTEEELNIEYISNSSYFYMANLDSVTKKAAQMAKQKGSKIFMDADSYTDELLDAISWIDIFIGSEFVYEKMLEAGKSVKENCEYLYNKGPEIVIFTFGEKGLCGMICWICSIFKLFFVSLSISVLCLPDIFTMPFLYRSLFDDKKRLSVFYRRSVFDKNLFYRSLKITFDLIHKLHRFHDPENRSLFYFVSCLHERSSSFFRRRIENSDKRSFHYFAF